MKLIVLVEGRADQLFLQSWLRRARPGLDVQVITHSGKGSLPEDPRAPAPPGRKGLLDLLPAKLRAFGQEYVSDQVGVLVLVDADDEDCHALKARLVQLLQSCEPAPRVLFRVACEESEAFYLGDLPAIERVYGPLGARGRAAYEAYVQDSVCGTWEVFREVIGAGGENKSAWASAMGNALSTDLEANRSPSFRQLGRAIDRLTQPEKPQ